MCRQPATLFRCGEPDVRGWRHYRLRRQGSTPQTRSFCPDDNVTREEMAAFIVRAVTGTTTPASYNHIPYFTDVPATNPFFPHIQKLMDLGITTGCAPGLFCPTDTIPRWEMAIFMVRARLALHGATFTTATRPYFADVPTNVEGNGMPVSLHPAVL